VSRDLEARVDWTPAANLAEAWSISLLVCLIKCGSNELDGRFGNCLFGLHSDVPQDCSSQLPPHLIRQSPLPPCYSGPTMNISFFRKQLRFSGPGGILNVGEDDQVSRRLAMLIVGECEGQGASQAARQFHFSRQRYYQLLAAFQRQGALGLALELRGPKTDYRRTEQIVRLVIRHRFLDAEASAEVIAQKLRQVGHTISQRSVERIIADYGLQKKTLRP